MGQHWETNFTLKGRRRSNFIGSSIVLGAWFFGGVSSPRKDPNSEDAANNDLEREAVERGKQVARSKQHG